MGEGGGGSCSREYFSIKSRSTVPSVPYNAMKPIRLIHSQVTLTVGEIPFLVSRMPCTSHGCRPLSVRNQPAVFIRKGSTAAQVATHRKTRETASVFRRINHSPHREMIRVRPPR